MQVSRWPVIQQCLIDGCDPESSQVKQADSATYLMKKLDCPVHHRMRLSVQSGRKRAADEAYHKQLAAAVICGYLRSQRM
ncbi:MAG: hypothetical protein ACLT4C_04470 [Butyricicoccus sp.]